MVACAELRVADTRGDAGEADAHYDGNGWIEEREFDDGLSALWGTKGFVLVGGLPSTIRSTASDASVRSRDRQARATNSSSAPTTTACEGPRSAVWGSSANDVWIVGDEMTILHGSMP
jgi:hypothetical protein